ncbi:aminopeptidase [Ammoniphilus sp. 3BR4]|uniref:aminopeptidase n=1 Tax=Ammoniphilus sp. 3BR4 TaxID=3158265 RepID=UPI003466BF1D
MNHFETLLDRYAQLAVKVGVNIQPGQTLVITAPLASVDFVRKITRKAYESGAKNVHTEWTDDELTRIKYDLAPQEAFQEYPQWRAKGFEEMAANNAAFLSIVASNPDLLKGVDPERITAANKATGEAMAKFRSYAMSDKVSWTVIAVPSPAWAAKVFPDLPEQEQMEALWQAIFETTRVTQEDPVKAWQDHNDLLNQKAEYLNNRRYRFLHYEAPGTKLSLELPAGHIWVGAGSLNEKGTPFMANMPTEEVFTTPLKQGVNGTVRSTKPLSYSGNLIENFSLTFEKGRIVDFSAEKGYEVLKRLVETDEGSHYLGEVALVPHESPISRTNLIFYNTLFDENASNHLAIGNSYAFCLEGGKNMSKEELEAQGLNSSITHVDFMVGSDQMNIDGETADGTREPIFRNGNWA